MNLNDKPTILQKIVLDKIEWIKQKQAVFPLESFKQNITKSDRSFYTALAKGTHQRPAYILECKKASPSKGLIRAEFNLDAIANVYKHYAAAVSVLTDEKYFQGNFAYIKKVRDIVAQPVLCKDFIVDEYQVYLARYHHADAILLMLSVVDDETYMRLANLAHSLGMGVLTETSNQAELDRAIALGAKVIGINNRDLHDLSVDLNRTPSLARQIPADRIIISESGIYSHRQVQQLKPYVHAFLIGSSLMGSEDLNSAIRAIIFGENKVCGLTRPQDVRAVYAQGALYGGLIFAEKSPRCLSLRQAQELVVQAPLRFVGVFQNQPIDFICKIAAQLNLFAVQLHGSETEEFITALRTELTPNCQIWRAISVDTEQQSAVQIQPISAVDRYVFDSKNGNRQGGTGETFNWATIPAELKDSIMLAGGINAENLDSALAQHCLGIDLNSGVESSAGIKDHTKLAQLFNRILDN
ncbi:bifunctional indole-3-glycerol-phosphate synthase TrpC/phosphoribosylanthranilate isomerase TrpF [Caviibacterium pharyngocola]|uniref:Multifunctional fusion protein n=1 Tax=Caviibacterium pharyngocola TaxID=28159 RepID=A0A2M8RZ00_9PAST|nr:bifunctional indole-3-glycerol-phosphate synthase TrpC/phosphoribosylanthranilate isomerase TrpF [Caviibacterium pharyngocola]PJG84123.1 bifunctional indole-3-glycerol-phosphate synthase TrpC/phosphoribosylanthranilate isomerase TrpF [Caviibacterium pharyngocola]